MILRHTGAWLEPTISHNAEGMVTKAWATLASGECDIQPANLNENELKLFGITDQKSSVKKIFFEANKAIVEGLRFYDFENDKLYDVRGSNEWSIHHVVLGIPVLGERYAPIAPTVTHFGPLSGNIGAVVTVSGTGFVNVLSVSLGAVAATVYTVIDSHTINVTIPLTAATGKFSVTTDSGTGQSPYNFTVTYA